MARSARSRIGKIAAGMLLAGVFVAALVPCVPELT